MNVQDELQRQEQMLEALLVDQRRRAVERVELARRAAEARAAVPDYLQGHLQQLAAERQQYTVKGFFMAVYKMLPDRWTTLAALTALFEYYLAMHDVASLGTSGVAASNWGLSGMGPTPSWHGQSPPPPMAPPPEGPGYFASAAPEESVVEAAFAKHKRKA